MNSTDSRPLYLQMFLLTLCLTPVLMAVSVLSQAKSGTRSTQKVPGPARMPVVGTVWNSKDVPVVGAEVYFVSNLVAGVPELGGNDIIRVESDERGRYSARLLPGRGYSAWAWTTHKDGGTWSSRMMEGLSSGQKCDFLLLRSRPEPELRLGANRIGARFGKILYAWGGRHFVLRELEGVLSGKVAWPRMPGGELVLRFFDEKGRPIRQRRFSLARLAPDSPVVLTPRAPRLIRIRVQDGKLPLQGVQVRLSLSDWNPELARTDRDGEAVFPLLAHLGNRDADFAGSHAILLLKPGYPITQVSITGVQGDATTMTPYSIAMSRSHRLHGRLLDAKGRARKHVSLALFTRAERACDTPGVTAEIACPLIFRTDSRGDFDLAGLSDYAFHRLLALPIDGSGPILLSSHARPVRADLSLGEMRPADFTSVQLRIQDAQGRAMPHARLFLGETTRETRWDFESHRPFRLFPDDEGRASLLCSRHLRPVFTAAWQGAVVERTPGPSPQGQEPLCVDLRFPKLIRLSGRLVHSDLHSFLGATLRVHRSRGLDHALPIPLPKDFLEIVPQPVHKDGSFEFYTEPASLLSLRVFYTDPAEKPGQHYRGRFPPRIYKVDTKNIRITLTKSRD